jgi:hypothetical protein
MPIKPPAWSSKTAPVANGWKHWATSEILLNKRFTQEEIDGFWAEKNGPAEPLEDLTDLITEGKIQAEMIRMAREEVHEPDALENMSKRELEELGREHGVELDRRKSKKVLVEQMKDIIPSK